MAKDRTKNIRNLWNTYVRPVIAPEKHLNLFGHRYNTWQAALATLDHREKQSLDFFIAFATADAPMKNYIDYIRQVSAFCDLCVRNPDSALGRRVDSRKTAQLKVTTDLLLEAVRNAKPAYLDRVRAEMRVPDLTGMQNYVRRTEIQALKEDVLKPPHGGPSA